MAQKCSRRLRMAGVGRRYTILSSSETRGEPIECQIDNWCRVQRKNLAEQQATDDGDAERPPQLIAGAAAECEGQSREERGDWRHHDRPETQQACLVDRVNRSLSFLSLRLEREVDHHDAVLLHDTDQEDDADQRNNIHLLPKQQQRKKSSYTCGWQCRKDRDRVNVTFIEHTEHDVHGYKRRKNQKRNIGK